MTNTKDREGPVAWVGELVRFWGHVPKKDAELGRMARRDGGYYYVKRESDGVEFEVYESEWQPHIAWDVWMGGIEITCSYADLLKAMDNLNTRCNELEALCESHSMYATNQSLRAKRAEAALRRVEGLVSAVEEKMTQATSKQVDTYSYRATEMFAKELRQTLAILQGTDP